jgi:hypothetical protein
MMKLRTGSHGGARPQEIIVLLGLEDPARAVRLCRTGLAVEGEIALERQKQGLRRRWGRTRSR